MKQKIILTEGQLRNIVKATIKLIIKESYEDFQPINGNNEDDYYRNKYRVYLWNGKGYILTPFDVYANNEEEALEIVVAYIDKEGDKYNLFADEEEQSYVDEEYNGNREEAEYDPMYQESFFYVDGTMEGAEQPHYIRCENLKIERL